MIENKNIILFDGNCLICNGFVRWIIKKDKNKIFLFGRLESDFGKKLISDNKLDPNLDSVLFFNKGKVFIKSTAALNSIALLPYLSFVKVLFIFPLFLRDWVYDFIAKNRNKIKKGQCPIPTKELLERIVD